MWFFKRSKALKGLEAKLLKAKNRDPEKYDSKEDKRIVIDAYNAMSEIEKNKHDELIPYLYDFLNDRDEYLRERAVQAFGGLSVEKTLKFKDIAYNIWNNKTEDDGVRFSAFGVWYRYYQETQDALILKTLYHVAKDKNYDPDFRANAIIGIMAVIGDTERYIHSHNQWLKLYRIRNKNEFESAIDWKDIEDIMRKYAPDALEESHI